MVFKFIKRHLKETIKRGGGGGRGGGCLREDSSPGRIQPAPLLQTQNFLQKILLNFSWCLAVPSITFIL